MEEPKDVWYQDELLTLVNSGRKLTHILCVYLLNEPPESITGSSIIRALFKTIHNKAIGKFVDGLNVVITWNSKNDRQSLQYYSYNPYFGDVAVQRHTKMLFDDILQDPIFDGYRDKFKFKFVVVKPLSRNIAMI